MDEQNDQTQFSLLSLCWLTLAVAMLLSYAQSLGAGSIWMLFIYVSIGVSVGVLVGAVSGKWHDCIFWSLLMNQLVYLAVAGGRLPNDAVFYGWAIIGAVAGALSAIPWPSNIWIGSTMIAFICSLLMVGSLVRFGYKIEGLVLFDVVCAFAVGTILRPFIQFLVWFQRHSKQPRIALASWLAISILVGNYLVPIVGGVQR